MIPSKNGVGAASWALALGLLTTAGADALAQLRPQRAYFGVGRPVLLHVEIPKGEPGEAMVQVFLPGGDQPTASVAVAAGDLDLATALPEFWRGATGLRYVQLAVGDKRIGAPVVLQPLKNPPAAMLWDARDKKPLWFDPTTRAPSLTSLATAKVTLVGSEDGEGLSGVRAYVEQLVVMATSLGEIEVRLRPDQAPNTCWNFMQLVRDGFYSDIIFHRIIGARSGGNDFMAQCGDPTGTGSGGPGYNIDFEPSKLPHDFGVLSMARSADPNTAGSQFFLCFSREGTRGLDGGYCAFGQAVRGAEVIAALAKVECVLAPGGDRVPSRPKDPPRLVSAKLVDAPPMGTGPKPVAPPSTPPVPR